MKRLLLLTIAMAAVISLVAVFGARSFGGTASAHVSTGQAHLEIDLVKDGSTWCNPVDTAASVLVSPTAYQVAICLSDSDVSPAAFQFDMVYNPALDTCSDATGSALDANPDANTGTTTFSSPDLGPGGAGLWNCNIGDVAPPTCSKGGNPGRAYLKCLTTDGATLPAGAGVSAPLAVVNLKAVAGGVDNLALENAAVFDPDGLGIMDCTTGGNCYGATETKVTPTPTPTPTPLPSECDITTNGDFAASDSALQLKVGDPPAVVTVSGTWRNLGHFTAGAPDAAMCDVGFVYGAEGLSGMTETAVPAGVSVRMEPLGQANLGDVCFVCINAGVGDNVGDCMKGAGPFNSPPVPPATWTYTAEPCDENSTFALPLQMFSLINHSCEDGIDNPDSDPGCDWANFSGACGGTPDPMCLPVQAIGITPTHLQILTPGGPSGAAVTREVKIQCDERGVYSLVVFGSSAQAGLHVLGRIADLNAANDVGLAPITVTCTKGPEMVKDCDTSTEGIQTNCNLWLMDPAFAGGVEAGTNPPVTLPAADDNGCVLASKGKGCLAVDVWLKSADDEDDSNDGDLVKECLGAWEHQVRFDHKIVKFINDLNPITIDTNGGPPAEVSWLESTGRVADCSVNVLAENWILEGCITTGTQNGPCGDGIVEKMLIVPQTNDLIYRGVFRPTKDNGVVTNIVDDNCEITDIYAEPMADTVAGGLTPVCGDLHITVRMLEGDLDLDCDVDVADEQREAFSYGASWGLQLYDQWMDLEPKYADQDIDIKDLQFVFGRNNSNCQAPIPDDQSTPVDPGQP